MASILELIQAYLTPRPKPTPTPPPPEFDPSRPWDAPSLRPPPQPVATPSPAAAPYQYATPDPYAQAQALQTRQEAAAKLASPMTPVLELPADLLAALESLFSKSIKPKKEKK